MGSVPGLLSQQNCKRIAIALMGVFLAANFYRRGPRVDTPADNYLAAQHRCTEYSYGWPLPIYQIFPEGYINPGEWLPWDCAPRFTVWNWVGMAVDDVCFAMLALLFVFAWRYRATPARVITTDRVQGFAVGNSGPR